MQNEIKANGQKSILESHLNKAVLNLEKPVEVIPPPIQKRKGRKTKKSKRSKKIVADDDKRICKACESLVIMPKIVEVQTMLFYIRVLIWVKLRGKDWHLILKLVKSDSQ